MEKHWDVLNMDDGYMGVDYSILRKLLCLNCYNKSHFNALKSLRPKKSSTAEK